MRTRGRILSGVLSVVLVSLSFFTARIAAQGGRPAGVRRAEVALSQSLATLSVTGTVRDASGAAVPAVTVVLVPDDAPGGNERTTTSYGSGNFRFDRVAAGVYRIEASAPGFTRFVQRGISVAAAEAASVTIVLRSRVATALPPDVALPAPPPPRAVPPVIIAGPPPPAPPASVERTPPGTEADRSTALDSGLAVIPVFYATDRQKISDIFLLFTEGLPPTSRPMLRSDGVAPRLFWRFVR